MVLYILYSQLFIVQRYVEDVKSGATRHLYKFDKEILTEGVVSESMYSFSYYLLSQCH